MYDAITPINASGITSSTSLTTTTTIHTWCCRPVCKGTDYLLKLLIIILISTWEWKFWVNTVDLDSLISMQFRDQCLIPELSLQCMTITGYQRWRSMLDPWKIPAVYDHHGISKTEINAWSLKNPCSVWPSRDIKDGDQCLIPEISLQCMTITGYQGWRSMLDSEVNNTKLLTSDNSNYNYYNFIKSNNQKLKN